MKVTAKIAGGKTCDVEIESKMTIGDVKALLAEPLDTPVPQSRLIFKGKICKDFEVVDDVGIIDGATLHVVKTKAIAVPPSASPPSQQQPTTASQPSTAPPSAQSATLGSGANGMPPGFADFATSLMGGMPPVNAAGGEPASGVPGMPAGLPFNMEMMQQMFSMPMIQNMMQSLTQNPEIVRQLMQANPMTRSMAEQDPMVRQMMEHPETMSQFFNPQAIQEGLRMFSQASGPQASAQPPAAAAPPSVLPVASEQPAQNPFAAMMGSIGAGNVGSGAANSEAGNGRNMIREMSDMLSNPAVQQQMEQLMSQYMGGGSGTQPGGRPGGSLLTSDNAAGDTRPPAERYSSQLRQLQDMGFVDRDANLAALQRTLGDVNAAISMLLDSGMGN